jgi:hypothetical protein
MVANTDKRVGGHRMALLCSTGPPSPSGVHSRLSRQLFDPVAERIHFARRRRVANCEHLTDIAGQEIRDRGSNDPD